ncbi:DNA polymerase III subunit delta [Candidatus Endobugula sertula]|uniref:DNA polymerase III subunit delta n=1 Tax=Candidatus Endobugula sertula TaxID=62101 RepID=A0A1D2QLM0_9GAMM|nr:DNA polymerase III subunit delta [Candidatus Endobugula sertula]
MARLHSDQLQQSLNKQPLAPIYLISGDEILLVQEACDVIRQAARASGFTERECYYVDKQFDWSILLSSVNSLSLFGDKRIIELRIDSGKLGADGSKAILTYVENISEDNVLVVITPKLDSGTRRSKWVKAIDKVGYWVPIWPISASQLPRWLGQRLQQAGFKANSQVIELLATRVEGNLLAACQEIEKLKLLAPDRCLSPELIANSVADSARYDVFSLVDKALSGDSRGAVRTLNGLRSDGTEPLTILWSLGREIRTLMGVYDEMEQGQSFSWAAKNAGVWEKRQPLVQRALHRLSQKQLTLLLRQANGIDKTIKGLRNANAWNELIELTLNLSGVQSIHPHNQRLSLQL